MATILDYLTGKGIILRTGLPEVYVVCPKCGTRKQKCSINVALGIGKCFRASCGFSSGFNFVTFISVLEGIERYQAYSIAARYSEGLENQYVVKGYGSRRDYPRNSLPAEQYFLWAQDQEEKVWFSYAKYGTLYLTEIRKLSFEQIDRHQLGFGQQDFSIGDKKIPRAGMVIIPILFNEQILGYCARSIDVRGKPLCTPKHYHAIEEEEYYLSGQLLYNVDEAFPIAKERGYLILVEDPWSAIKMGAVATLGSGLSDDQLGILRQNYKGPIVVCRDNDTGGAKAAMRDLKILKGYYEDLRMVIPMGNDPDEYLEDTLRRCSEALPLDLRMFDGSSRSFGLFNTL